MKEELREFVKNDRRDFQNQPLDESQLSDDPFVQFEIWFNQLRVAEVPDPYAFTLATADKNGRPSARVVYMRDISKIGLTCFTNYLSSKGRELAENPWFCGNFYWTELSRQVRFSGKVERLPREQSDAYFASRPRESQMGAWASAQSSTLPDGLALRNEIVKLSLKYEGRDVPRPPYWGGYLLIPDEIEFWQGRESRLHDRFLYSKKSESVWTRVRLSP